MTALADFMSSGGKRDGWSDTKATSAAGGQTGNPSSAQHCRAGTAEGIGTQATQVHSGLWMVDLIRDG